MQPVVDHVDNATVFKAYSFTTKMHVVYDDLAKTSNGLALNDILQVGRTV
jgi:hypothetical protein